VIESSPNQEIRSHLAYLRLTAAAEALPGELEYTREHDLGQSTRRWPSAWADYRQSGLCHPRTEAPATGKRSLRIVNGRTAPHLP
jgi:hypothetical protein